jgi:hypothetical protein
MLAVCGCSGTASTPTGAEARSAANEICHRVIDAVNWRKTPPYELVRDAARLAALEEQAAAELRKLEPRGTTLSSWQAMVDDFHATGQQFEKLVRLTKVNAEAAFSEIEPVLNAMRERAAEAHSAGLPACAVY